jgi:hypothetical protein
MKQKIFKIIISLLVMLPFTFSVLKANEKFNSTDIESASDTRSWGSE